MTTITQRRVAGATALMILLYLLQVALFAPSADAQEGNPPDVECASEDPDWNGKHYKVQVNEGELGAVDPESNGSITIAGSDEDGWTWTNSDTDDVFRVVYKAGASGSDLIQPGPWGPGDGHTLLLDRNGLSHITWCFAAPSTPPDPGSIVVTKTNTPKEPVDAPGGPVTFAVTIENTSDVAVTIDTLTDDIYGDVTVTTGDITATDCAVPQALAAADATVGSGPDFYSCSFTAPVLGAAGTTHTNTVTASGTDENENPVSDSDDATVQIVAPPAPGEADVQVTFGCDEEDLYVVNFSTSNATLVWTVNGLEEAVVSGQSFAAGTEVSWEATADAEHEFGEGADVSGSFTAADCGDAPPPPPPPPPPTTTTTLQSTSVNFDAFCDEDLNFVGAFSLPNASGSLDINGDGFFGAGETNLASGTYVLTGETYAWQATADAGFTLTGITSGSGETETCAEVLGTTITTTPSEVSADTLPFTGSESGDAMKMGLLALLAGVLMLFAVRGPKENEPVTVDMGGWSSL